MNSMSNDSVDIIIPIYRPREEFLDLLERLIKQSYQVNRIILINTEQKYFDERLFLISDKIEVHHIDKKDFDHAATRDMAIRMSDAKYVLFMTMDAMPASDKLVGRLVDCFAGSGETIAVAYARQLPRKDCRMQEKYTRKFNYPEESMTKNIDSLAKLGIKTYFCSDVCAMYDREIYLKNGGFEAPAIFNEDMVYAAKAVNTGYSIRYCAEAKVRHSHNYSCTELFKRNFDMGVSQAMHPEVFSNVSSESEGMKLVINTAKYLCKNGHWYEIPYLFVSSAYKYLGYKKGLKYRKLKYKTILKYTSNAEFWRHLAGR